MVNATVSSQQKSAIVLGNSLRTMPQSFLIHKMSVMYLLAATSLGKMRSGTTTIKPRMTIWTSYGLYSEDQQPTNQSAMKTPLNPITTVK